MDLIRSVLLTRSKLHVTPAAAAKPKETDHITMATIIEERPKRAEVIKFFRARADVLDCSS